MKKCMTCFRENPDSASKCMSCGANLDAYLSVKNVKNRSAEESTFLLKALRTLSILSFISGIIVAISLWPKPGTYDALLSPEVRDLVQDVPLFNRHPEFYMPSIIALIAGIISWIIFASLAEILERLGRLLDQWGREHRAQDR